MRKLLSILIAFTPFNRIRIFLYRIFLGYKIDYTSKIGMFTIINSKEVDISAAKIGPLNYIDTQSITMMKGSLINKFNRIKHLHTLLLKENSIIFSWNFIGGSKDYKNLKNQNVELGRTSEILRNNYFDVVQDITIGNNVVFGGNGSEVWTHGFDTDRNMLSGKVIFGDNIFIGSKCIFTKGISIASDTIIGPGSVVYKNITERGLYSSQQLVKIK